MHVSETKGRLQRSNEGMIFLSAPGRVKLYCRHAETTYQMEFGHDRVMLRRERHDMLFVFPDRKFSIPLLLFSLLGETPQPFPQIAALPQGLR